MKEYANNKLNTELIQLTGDITTLKQSIEKLQNASGVNFTSLPHIQKAINYCDELLKIVNQLPLKTADMVATQRALEFLAKDLDSDLTRLARQNNNFIGKPVFSDKSSLVEIHARVESLLNYAKTAERNAPNHSLLGRLSNFSSTRLSSDGDEMINNIEHKIPKNK
jgi:hypothetical protein